MAELELLSARLRCGSSQQRALTWHKLVSLGESGLEGEQVGNLTIVACDEIKRISRVVLRQHIESAIATLLNVSMWIF